MDLSLVKVAPTIEQQAAQRASQASLSLADQVRVMAAKGLSFAVEGNTDALDATTLRARADELKLELRAVFPPTLRELTGSEQCKTVCDFNSAVTSDANILGVGDSRFDIARLVANVFDACTVGDSVLVEKAVAYSDYFSYVSTLIQQLAEESAPLAAAQDDQRQRKAAWGAADALATQQHALEAMVSDTDILVRDEKRATTALLDEVKAIRDELSASKVKKPTKKKEK
jgi:hypothetical protein